MRGKEWLPECCSFTNTKDLALSAVFLTHLGLALPLGGPCPHDVSFSQVISCLFWNTPVTLTVSPLQYRVTVPLMGAISDLCEALSKLSGIAAENVSKSR